VSAQTAAVLACACVHAGVKPRKGVLGVLGGALQVPLQQDLEAALRYTVQARTRSARARTHPLGMPIRTYATA
jgi:hypothetical protein